MIINNDCLDEMRKMEPNSISCIVTDPPYGLKFMGKEWDHGIPGVPFWKEALRICKPGSHLLAFGGTRTFHRLTCAIEDAGWEIRDCLMWLYGAGFPKSHNHFGIEGYGTALKPAWEPIIMAMKPCDGTFMQNAEKWGQAGINIDGCRIVYNGTTKNCIRKSDGIQNHINPSGWKEVNRSNNRLATPPETGRWPANLILDEESGKMLDEQSGILKSGSGDKHSKTQKGKTFSGLSPISNLKHYESDSGGAARFFYCAKASSKERGESNNHPTIKPLKLMEYLIKLVMPPKDGILLDPFAGSGTTILAAKRLGFDAIGIEKDEGYCEIARGRESKMINLQSNKKLNLNHDRSNNK